MRIIALLLVAACVLVTSAQAQHSHLEAAPHDELAGSYAGAFPYGCCADDVSHCFDAWSTYCSDRKPRGTCLACRGTRGCGMGACGCNDQCGIFQNQPCGCGPKFSFRLKKHAAVVCDDPECAAAGCADGCDADRQADVNEDLEPSNDDPEKMPLSPLDSARGYLPHRSPLMAPGADAAVERPVAPEPNTSAERWYLPYKWKK